MKNICILILILSFAGCAAATPSALRETATAKGNVISVTVDENYQSVYRRLAEKMRGHFKPAIIGGFKVDADLYPDLGCGELSATEVALNSVGISMDG
jgi:hypothetical protein